MSTAAATATDKPAEPERIRRLIDDGRISAEGHKSLAPAWCTFASAADIDKFYEQPGAFLDGALGVGLVAPHQLLYVVDDANTVFSIGLLLMCRLDGKMSDVVELFRKTLPAALPVVSSDGWGIAHNPTHGWHVTKDGVVVLKHTNLLTENKARAAMQAEIQNSMNRR